MPEWRFLIFYASLLFAIILIAMLGRWAQKRETSRLDDILRYRGQMGGGNR